MKHLVKAICDFGSPWFNCNCMTVIDEKEVAGTVERPAGVEQ